MPSIQGALDRLQPLVSVAVSPSNDLMQADEPAFENETYQALIDTGATRTCITRRVIERFDLRQRTRLLINTATSTERRKAYPFRMGFYCETSGRLGSDRTLFMFPDVIVGPDFVNNSNFDVLIGMDVLSQGRLVFEKDGTFSFDF